MPPSNTEKVKTARTRFYDRINEMTSLGRYKLARITAECANTIYIYIILYYIQYTRVK